MPGASIPGSVCVSGVAGVASARRIEPAPATGRALLVSGFSGDALPSQLHDVLLESSPSAGHWQLTSREGCYRFQARGVERFEARPDTFAPLLTPFALRARDRRVVRVLLALLRLPGGAWLLRTWQARRG